jgi:Fe-S-cluster-containing dehydrogenase component
MLLSRRNLLKKLAVGGAAAAVSSVSKPVEARGAREASPEALGLLYDGTLCIGCRACIPACKAANNMPNEHTQLDKGNVWDAPLDISGHTLNVIKVYKDGDGTHKDQVKNGFAFTKVSCMHCLDPSCVSACPVSAMTKDPKTGVVSYNLEACIGCRYCVAACPFNVPRFTYDTPFPKISKCQLCQHRYSEGKYSACAEVCPTGATLFGPVSELKKEVARRKALKPGTRTVFPRGRIGSKDTYEGTIGTYVERVYGENEIGGTQVLHLSGVPFELLNKPELPDEAPAKISESLQHTIYNHLIAPLGFLAGMAALTWRHMRGEGDEAEAPPPKSEDDKGGER